MFFVTVAELMGDTLLHPIKVLVEVEHEEAATGFVERASLVVFHATIPCASRRASKDVFGNPLNNSESTSWKRMRSGDRPGLQNRRAAGFLSPVGSTPTRFRQRSLNLLEVIIFLGADRL